MIITYRLLEILFLCIIASSILSGCITPVNTISIDGKPDEWNDIPIFIQDDRGDVINQIITLGETTKELYEFDIISIKCSHDTIFLYMLIELADDVSEYFNHNQEYARSIAEFYFDLDNNQSTGGPAHGELFKGFESRFNIYSGVWDKTTGYAVSGRMNLSTSENTELGFFIEYYTSKYNEDIKEFPQNTTKIIHSYDHPELLTYNEQYIELKLPLQELSLVIPSQPIRMVFHERGSGLGVEAITEHTNVIIPEIKE